MVDSRCLVILLLCLAIPSALLADDNTDPFARDLLVLTDWFEGEFDNEEQIWFQADSRSQTPEADRHVRLHVAHHRLALPKFGEHVFYVEEYRDNDPTNVIRQRFVIFSSDSKAGAIRMRQGFFKDPEKVLGAHNDASKLSRVQPDDVFFLDECDVFWHRVADQYEGGMRPKTCVFGEGKQRRYSVHNLVLSANKYWRVDSTFLVTDDSLHLGYPVDRPLQMRRAKIFICEASFRGTNGESQSINDLVIHSQGGTALLTRAGDGAEFILRIRDKEYPYYNTRPDFIYFSFRAKDAERSIVFTVNDSDSRRIGFSTPTFAAHCHRKGYDFREILDAL